MCKNNNKNNSVFNPTLPSVVPKDEENNVLMKYLQQSSTNLDILDKFPKMKSLFIKQNTGLPTSAPVERLFSQTTLLDLGKFNRMSDSYFKRRILCKANRKMFR